MKWTNEVWGLSLGYDDDTYFTCSDDSILRKWSISKRKCLESVDLNIDGKGIQATPDPKTNDLQDSSKTRSIDIHPKGLAVIGTMDGTVKIVNVKASPMKFMGSFKHRTRWIQELKFSPDGTKLAVGAHDAWLNFYEVPSFKMIGKAKKHSSAITHLDWSTDSRFIHSTDQACELLFFDTAGKQITAGATMFRDQEWAAWSVVFGWPVKGIWQAYMDASDINMVDRSFTAVDSGYKLLACGNDKSQITVYRYPCLTKGAEFVLGTGHASHVTNVKFSRQDKYLLSTGGEDQTVMQWRIFSN
jgi:WD40 repeat protein